MRRVLGVALAAGVCLAAVGGGAASSAGRQDAGALARERAARFNKDKHKVKEKRGVRLEVFVEMRAAPAVRSAAEYSGEYVAEPDFHLELHVAADGSAGGSGREPGDAGGRRFTLRDARVSGALLDATKVYGTDARSASKASSSTSPRATARTTRARPPSDWASSTTRRRWATASSSAGSSTSGSAEGRRAESSL